VSQKQGRPPGERRDEARARFTRTQDPAAAPEPHAPSVVEPIRRHHPLPFGAEPHADGVRFRLWAPAAADVVLCLYGDAGESRERMRASGDGWFECHSGAARVGSRYRYCIDGNLQVPDPASRFQPDDVAGPSEVIDPCAYAWQDGAWRGRPLEQAVFYELHVGSFTPQGTYAGVIERLDHLIELGITAIELMPLADFPGRRNWGYDGVLPFAPDSSYGRPEELKALVDAAHQRGLMVFLDVVYNHFGPEGNYLASYAPAFFNPRHATPWGAAINYDGAHSRTVRDFFIQNALYWLSEYHFDGLRIDAAHAICDDSVPHILIELADAVRSRLPAERQVHLVLENDNNAAHFLARDAGGRPRWYDAQWNDDLHHAWHVILTGESIGYYRDYADAPTRHLGRACTQGFAYQGEPSPFRGGRPRGEPSAELPGTAFVAFLQNHDQIGNRAFGERLHQLVEPDALRAAVTAMLLAPALPLLFMGEEWAAPQPFPFFCDFGPALAEKVREGRAAEFAGQWTAGQLIDPNAEETFRSAVLDWQRLQEAPHSDWLALYRELLAIRAREIVPRLAAGRMRRAQYRRLDERALRLTWRFADDSQLILLLNLSRTRVAGVQHPNGRLLAAAPKEIPRARGLPPWAAAWYLLEPADAAPAT